MSREDAHPTDPPSTPWAAPQMGEYDPFVRGRFSVGVRTIQALDAVRNRLFPCEVWYPAAAEHAGQDTGLATQDVFTEPPGDTPRRQMAVRDAAARPGSYPLIIFSHSSGGRRRQSTFLCTHLSSHGYIVAALDHSEAVAPELRRSMRLSDAAHLRDGYLDAARPQASPRDLRLHRTRQSGCRAADGRWAT